MRDEGSDMTKILENLKVGDAVIVNRQAFGPDRNVRKVRSIDYVAKMFKHVLQTRGGMCGVGIGTGFAVDAYGPVYVTPATEQDVVDVLREIEDRKRADAERKAQQEAEAAEKRRRDKLTGAIREILYRYVPESVLVHALAVLRGDA
jgi:FtsZ-interacting cell division protein YlmF